MKKALITGITGQDGSYLAEFLLEKRYEVHGMVRRSSSSNTQRINHLTRDNGGGGSRLYLHYGDLTDGDSIRNVVRAVQPDEVYNLGGQSHVGVSFDIPVYTVDAVALSCMRLLEAIRELRETREIAYFQASSSEMFGKVKEVPQSETTPFHPRSPYACAKVFGYWQTVNYREAYGIHASNGIMFNHESPRRGENFVTRKITRALARILARKQDKLILGNLDAKRDWGYAKDYVEAMWLMLQQPQGDDFIIATGEAHSVRDFLQAAFSLVGLDWEKYVEIDPRQFRPAEVDFVVGDGAKARDVLKWKPPTMFPDLVSIMVAADLAQEGLDLDNYR